MSVLVRKELPESAPDIFDVADADFAAEVAAKLGYKAYRQTIERHQKSDAAEVLAAIRALDTAPFTRASVDRYKARKARAEWMKSKWSVFYDCYWWFFGAVVVVMAASIAAGITMAHCYESAVCWFGIVPAMLAILGAVTLAVMYVNISWMTDRRFRPRRATWEKHHVAGFTGAIPAYALQWALDIKQACPGATLFVDELMVRDEEWSEPRSRDPFFGVQDNQGNTYWLAVWDEPNFKAKREDA
jgi:ABC-type sugar transport system permease subunit